MEEKLTSLEAMREAYKKYPDKYYSISREFFEDILECHAQEVRKEMFTKEEWDIILAHSVFILGMVDAKRDAKLAKLHRGISEKILNLLSEK